MKHCQTCRRVYRDESVSYCWDDGSLLCEERNPAATGIRTAEPTSVAGEAFADAQRQPSSSSYRSRILYPAVLLLTVLIGGSFGWFLFRFNDRARLFPVSETGSAMPGGTPSPTHNSAIDNSSARQARMQADPETFAPQDLSGVWNIVNTVDKTSYQTFANLQIGYRLVITQNGANFTAQGEKLLENGRNLPEQSRTTLRLTGAVSGDTVQASFIEEGTRRKTKGTFVWRVEHPGNMMTGSFVSTAANSSGRSVGTKEH